MKPLILLGLPLMLCAGLTHAAADSTAPQGNAPGGQTQITTADNNTANTSSNLNDAFCTAGTPCAVVKQRNAGLH